MSTLFAGGALLYLILCGALFFLQRRLIYFPQPRSLNEGAAAIRMQSAGADLVVTARPHPGPNAVIYFGGNAEDVSYNLPSFSAAFPDHAIYLLHYRSYGGSTGRPSEAAISTDALALFDRVKTTHDSVVAIGRSLGAAVAIKVARERPVARVVLVTPFASLRGLASRQFPYVPVGWLLRDKFESWKHAEHVTAPTLIIAAEHDEVVPRSSTEALYRRFRPGIASLCVVAGTGHNTVSESAEYVGLLSESE